jgi:cytoskeletal protein CcmA (bactofilin family)
MDDKQQGRFSAAGTAEVRSPSYLSAGLRIKGEVTGNEDLHIDGKLDGSISVGGFRLTVGKGATVNAEAVARELVIYGEVKGDLRARDLVEVKKEGSVQGDILTARIMIEDGAFFKGNIEIDRSNSKVGADLDTLLARGKDKSVSA